MNTIRVVFAVLVGSFISFGMTESTAVADKAPPKVGMTFSRDSDEGPACLEYAWISEGKRRVVRLAPGKREGVGPGPGSHDASHVNVFRLSNNINAGLKQWQFPPGGPYSAPVVAATVEVHGMEVVGTVYYKDDTTASDKHRLDPKALLCPE